MIVGNIVSTTKINVLDDFNVVKSMDDIIHGLPTLIIGWDIAIKKFPDLDVITRKAADNVFWTFKKNEKREIFEEDVYNFTHFAYEYLIKDITYYFIDPTQLSTKNLKKVIRKIRGISNPVIYQHDDMIYIYGEKLIFGLDLNLLEFIGINRNKIISKLSSNNQVFLHKNEIFIEYKKRVENLDNQVKYIPYLYSIEHG